MRKTNKKPAGRGQPKKAPSSRRDTRLAVYLTKTEYSHVKTLAASEGLSIASWARLTLLAQEE